MENVKSSVILKTITFALQQVCFIIMAVTLFIGITYWNYDDASFDIIEQDDFTKTNYYKRLVEDNIYDLITYIDYCGKFQTDGRTDEKRIVDIYDYVDNNRITGKTTISLGYSVGDLLQWQKDGFAYVPESQNVVPGSTEPPGDSEYYLEEMFSNSDGISLKDYALQQQLDYKELCRVLENAAGKLSQEFEDYKNQVSLFKANNTNLRYAVYNADMDVFYSNMEVEDIQEGMKLAESMETYVVLDSTTAEFFSNIFYANDQLNHYLNRLYINNQNYILAVGVDTEFPVLDTFHKEQLRYDNFEEWFQVLYKLLIISIIGYVCCFFYLSVAAGHKKGCQEVALNFFDRIKTELLVLSFVALEGWLVYFIREMINGSTLQTINPVNMVKIGLVALSAGVVFTICHLSFARRLKARTVWENSIINMVISLWNRLRENKKLWVKVVLFYGLLLVAALLLGYFTGSYLEIVIGYVILILAGVLIIRDRMERQKIIDGCRNIADGDMEFQIETRYFYTENKELGEAVNQIRFALHEAVEDSIKNERLKTNLITNVSHDIKTPLTSIINYVSLLKNISLENETANNYIQILEDKSLRLKHLTEDLVEASKISSKNIKLEKTTLNLVELVKQTGGEFQERFEEKSLTLVTVVPEDAVLIEADGRRIWRVLENIYNNALKYSLTNSRIFAHLIAEEGKAVFTLKNTSAQPLSVEADELTKRFVRGDSSRTTEGSGLGLSIAKDLTELHGGTFSIVIDGDLFCVQIELNRM